MPAPEQSFTCLHLDVKWYAMVKLTAYIVYMIAGCLAPAVLLALVPCRGWDTRPRCAPRGPPAS